MRIKGSLLCLEVIRLFNDASKLGGFINIYKLQPILWAENYS